MRLIELENNAKYLISILKNPNSDDFETSRDYSDNFNNRYEDREVYENFIYKKNLLNKNLNSYLLVTFLRDAKVKAEKKKDNSVHLARKGEDFIAVHHRSRRIRPKQKITKRKRPKQKKAKRKRTKNGRKRKRTNSIKEVLNNFLAYNI